VDIKRRRFEWLGHVIGMYQIRVATKIFERKPEGRRKVGSQRFRWLEDDLWDLIVKSWRRKENNRKWTFVVKVAKVLRGL
jgi:hypothetical protein